jgi:uncharacterized protein
MNARGQAEPVETAYRGAIVAYLRANARPTDKFSHQPRLYRLATLLAEGKPFDDDVVFAAAWLHDLGVFIGHRPEDPKALAAWDHIAYACRELPAVLQQLGFPSGKIPAVIEAIRTHLPSSTPTSFEGMLVRDADILEQLGAMSILRTVSKIGRDTRFVRFADALTSLRRAAKQLPAQIHLESARRLALPRLQTMEAFFAAVAAEAREEEL